MRSVEMINADIKELRDTKIDGITKDISDGYHTFGECYAHRAVLTAALFRHIPFTWKSKHHYDEENNPMFDGMFIVGVTTPDGCATYHYNLDKWDMFKIPEIANAPKFDGHTPDDVINRIVKYFARGVLTYDNDELMKLEPHLQDVCECMSIEEQDIYIHTWIK